MAVESAAAGAATAVRAAAGQLGENNFRPSASTPARVIAAQVSAAGLLLATLVRAGALVFGGGHVVLPLLRSLVANGLISEPNFIAGYGATVCVSITTEASGGNVVYVIDQPHDAGAGSPVVVHKVF